jgi:hypothetical protein
MSSILDRNRVIVCHFDSYSALLLFARFGRTLMLPGPAPESSVKGQPAEPSDAFAVDAVRAMVAERYAFAYDELVPVPELEEWLQTEDGPIRVHLFRLKCFSPPRELIAKHDGAWKPVSELRGISPLDLGYARRIFDLVMGG